MTSRYLALKKITHSGVDYPAGSALALSDAFAAPLLSIGAIVADSSGPLPSMPVSQGDVLKGGVDAATGDEVTGYVKYTKGSDGGVAILDPRDGSTLTFLPQLTTGRRETDAAWNTAIKLAPLPIVQIPTKINSVRGYCAVSDSDVAPNAAMQITLYDGELKRVARTNWQAVPAVGPFRFAHEEVTLKPGVQYFYGVRTDNATATFGETTGFGGFTTTAALPLPDSITTTTTLVNTFPALTAEYVTVQMPIGFADISREDGRYRALGVNKSNSQPWGFDKTTGYIVYSDNSGTSWYQVMPAPMNAAHGGIQQITYEGTKLFVLCGDCTIWMSSDLTSSATWTEISVPVAPGFRRSTATTRPMGMEKQDGYLCWAEYSNGDTLRHHPTDPAGPRLFKWKIATNGPWELAKEWSMARHIHSLYSLGVGVLFITIGDGTDSITGELLTDTGVHRCTDIVNNVFNRIQDNSFDRRYPVDMTYKTGVGWFFASDAPGVYAQSMRGTTGGHKVLAQQILIKGFMDKNGDYYDDTTGVRGGNSRSICIDAKNNLWFFSAEEEECWLIGSPPPYTHYVKCAKLPIAFLTMPIISGTRLLMFDHMYELGKFAGQK